MTTSTEALHHAAIELAQLGYSVIPCIAGGKQPACSHGLLDGTTSEELIDVWWKKNPTANVAIVTEGLIVVDVDGGNNPWLKDTGRMLELSIAPMAQTPSGGRHYYFRQPTGDFRNTQGKLAEKVDTRADGGYVVVPPSVRKEGAYRWLDEPLSVSADRLPLPPKWIVDALTRRDTKTCDTVTDSNGAVIPKGKRNATLASLAGTMRRKGMTPDAILAALVAENQARCRPPLADDEVERIAASVSRYEPQDNPFKNRNKWQPIVRRLDAIQPRCPTWLWDGRFILGAVNTLQGEGGVGKGHLTIDVAARLSRGDAMPPTVAPNGTYQPQPSLFISTEDALDFVVRPRFDAAGGLPHMIYTLSQVQLGDEVRQVQLIHDTPLIEDVILQNTIGLLVIDPYAEFMGDQLSVNNDQDNRRVLGPLAQMAERTGVCVLLVQHLNKKENLSAKNRGSGSVAIVNASRSVFLVGEDPEDTSQRIMAVTKLNLAPEPRSLRFYIESSGMASRIQWGDGECDVTANQILRPRQNAMSKLEQAKQIILDIFADGNMHGSGEVETSVCQVAGISESTYKRARKELGIVAEKSDFDGQWIMTLPDRNDQF